jgi:hypothetical protein
MTGTAIPPTTPSCCWGAAVCLRLGVRSSRQIERRCIEDLAFRVLAGNQTPDHVTIARFRVRHQQALAGFLVHSLKLCAAVGLVRVGILALDVTKLAGNAADKANRTLDKLEYEVAEILREAAEADQQEDRLRQAKARLEAEAAERQQRYAQRVAASAAAAAAKGRPQRWLKPRPPAKHARQGRPRKDGKPSASRSDGLRAAMTAKLASDQGKAR